MSVVSRIVSVDKVAPPLPEDIKREKRMQGRGGGGPTLITDISSIERLTDETE